MYICNNCGRTFNDKTAYMWHGEEACCPDCCSFDYSEAIKCKKCDCFFAEETGEHHLCPTCFGSVEFEYRYNPKKMYSVTNNVKTNVAINDFLSFVFTPEEIEKILLKELIIASASGIQDYKSYIDADRYGFAELVEEVISNEQTEER